MGWGAPFQTSADAAEELADLIVRYFEEEDPARKHQIEVMLRAKAKRVRERAIP